MSTDHVGHLGYARFDPEHPAHAVTGSGDELLRVYERVDALCGELIEAAAARSTARSRPSSSSRTTG